MKNYLLTYINNFILLIFPTVKTVIVYYKHLKQKRGMLQIYNFAVI